MEIPPTIRTVRRAAPTGIPLTTPMALQAVPMATPRTTAMVLEAGGTEIRHITLKAQPAARTATQQTADPSGLRSSPKLTK